MELPRHPAGTLLVLDRGLTQQQGERQYVSSREHQERWLTIGRSTVKQTRFRILTSATGQGRRISMVFDKLFSQEFLKTGKNRKLSGLIHLLRSRDLVERSIYLALLRPQSCQIALAGLQQHGNMPPPRGRISTWATSRYSGSTFKHSFSNVHVKWADMLAGTVLAVPDE